MKEFFDYKLFEMGTYTLKLYNLLLLLVFIAFVILFLWLTRRLIYRSKTLDAAKKFSVSKLMQYIIATVAVFTSLHILGFNISVLLAGSAALLVGLGFGLQNLFNDFISGIILLLDRTLKVGDIIEVNDRIYKVQDINFRTTTAIGRDENYVILPNSELTGNRVVNWTYGQLSSRFRIDIGVDYATDVELLMKILKETAQNHPKVLKEPETFVRFEDYADSALMFSVNFYTEEIFRVERIKSDIRVEIYKVLKDNGINIPFPQRVVHFKGKD